VLLIIMCLHIYGKIHVQWSYEEKTCVFLLNLHCEKNFLNGKSCIYDMLWFTSFGRV